ncbi:MAG: 16S rRNA (guanine(527)-N(7))-methyltransferase RsmG [Gammaproteobacteria bacterium]|nr:16S rRNA (guanine(527)-N(7))-methyltransferase RsmG [Gammaproteobacteria bacterium]
MACADRASQDVPADGPESAPGGAYLRYLALLQQWNRAYNLTSITALDDMIVRHVHDSLTVQPFLAGHTVLDAGTGAGLPGIPLAIAEPSRHFTLVDSIGKKVRFLQQVITELRLGNVTAVQARLERWHPPAGFDTVVCRALGSLAEFVDACGPLAAPGGRLVAMKGRRPQAELAGVSAPWRVTALERVTVAGLDAERHIVVLER